MIRKKTKKTKTGKRRQKSIASVVEDCAKALQKLVRVKAAVAARANGMVQCVTCGMWKHWKEMQGGHFIERGKTAVKLVEEQINPQCPYCNQWGMKMTSCVLRYEDFLVDRHGRDWVEDLKRQSRQVVRFDRGEVEQLTKEYRDQCKQLEAEL